MEQSSIISTFFSLVKDDPAIGSTHICLYMTLFQFFLLNGYHNPIRINRAEVMKTAKILGIATYHKCMNDLSAAGYIKYDPSYDPRIGSRVQILLLSE